jgi:two-component system, sensor histidine kinase YesM
MKRFFIKRFATRVVLTVSVVILIPTIFISIFFYASSSKIIKKNVRESSIQLTKQAADSLSFIFSTGTDLSDIVYSNEGIQEAIQKDLDPSITQLEKNRNDESITQLLNSNVFSSSFVRNIYILKEVGTSWGSGTFSRYKFSKYPLEELNWTSKSIKNNGEVVWEGLQFDRFSGAGENIQLILPISRVMKDFDNLENIAYLQVYLDGEGILNTINQLKLGTTGRFFVIDEDGKVMIHNNRSLINKKVQNKELFEKLMVNDNIEFEFEQNNKHYYAVKQRMTNGWMVVGTVPVQEITGELVTIQKVTWFYSIFFTLIAILIGWVLANRVTQPVNTLTDQMKLVGKGNFNVRTDVQSGDEIGIMSSQFNKMIHQIDKLMVQITAEQKEKKEAELRAIRHRINPHFLFNTLSTIRWLMKFNQTEKANTALSSLIRLLEANMGKKGTFVTLAEEIDIVEKFIDILQIRYDQHFHLDLKIDPSLQDFEIPQMLLQPIVENAIFHGIVPTSKEGTIFIIGKSLDNGAEIMIKNEGIPIHHEKLKQLDNQNRENSFIGIGLLHVYDSIRLYFASDSSVTIDSDENGTVVILKLTQNLRG